jgi:tripartite-type tricarboxylate transporter receptor subunit TctC
VQRRHLLSLGMAGLIGSAAAQQEQPLRLLVGFAPGGSADIFARLLADKLREVLGNRNVIVENKPGAAGRIAIDALKASPPDGNTLILMPSGPVVLFPHVFRKLSYDPVKDLTPISQLANIQMGLASGPKSNVKNMAEMVAKTKASKAPASYGTSGNGTVLHFMGLMIGEAAGIDMEHIPYQGGAPAMNALVGGQIDYTVDVVSEAIEQHRAGKVRIIAVANAQRSSLAPDVPTLREQGIAMDASAWYAIYGPAGMASDMVTRLNTAVVAALKDPGLRARLQQLGLEPIGSTPSQLAAVQKADLEKWAKPVKASGFQAD